MKKPLALFLIFSLTACGWHLRGSTNIPKELTQLYITAKDSQGELITETRQLLKTNHITLLNESTEAIYSLYITEESKDKRTAGVGNDAISSAYEITLKAEYEIRIKNTNKTYISTAASVRSFNYTTTSINSAAQEEVLLEKEMRRDLAQQMLLHLAAVISHPQANDGQFNNQQEQSTDQKEQSTSQKEQSINPKE